MNHQHNFSRKSALGNAGIWEAGYAPARRGQEMTKLIVTLLAAVGLLFVVTIAKPALSQAVQLVKVDVSVVGKGLRASKLVGASVVNDKNERIGKIDDIIIDQNNVMFAVLQVGGFLGVGSRLVAIPYDSLQVDEAGKKVVVPGASKDELKKLNEFRYLG